MSKLMSRPQSPPTTLLSGHQQPGLHPLGRPTGRAFSEEHDVEQGKNPRDIHTGDFPTKQPG